MLDTLPTSVPNIQLLFSEWAISRQRVSIAVSYARGGKSEKKSPATAVNTVFFACCRCRRGFVIRPKTILYAYTNTARGMVVYIVRVLRCYL